MKPRTWPLDVYMYRPWFEVSEDDRVRETMGVYDLLHALTDSACPAGRLLSYFRTSREDYRVRLWRFDYVGVLKDQSCNDPNNCTSVLLQNFVFSLDSSVRIR